MPRSRLDRMASLYQDEVSAKDSAIAAGAFRRILQSIDEIRAYFV